MRWLVWFLLLFAVAVGFALAPQLQTGNVSFLWPPYRIDVSTTLFALGLLVVIFIAHTILLALGLASGMPARMRGYQARRRERKTAAALNDAVQALFEGRYGRAERLAEKAAGHGHQAGLAALIGARAAHRQRQSERVDQWLSRADAVGGNDLARAMTRAELAIEQRDWRAALAAIDTAHAGGARHLQALRLALRAYEMGADWPSVLRTVKMLEKRDALHPLAAQKLRSAAYGALLSARSADPVELKRLWAGVPSADRVLPELAGQAADAFTAAGQSANARQILEAALDKQWSPALIARYAAMDDIEASERLSRAEGWQRQYGDEPGLLRALGELCIRERLWGKAQDYLESSLRLQASAETHLALARLFDATDRHDLASAHYRDSGRLLAPPSTAEPPSSGALTALPAPDEQRARDDEPAPAAALGAISAYRAAG